MTRVPVVHQTPRSQTILGGSPTEKALKRFLEGIPGVDTIGAEARAAGFNTRSLKTSSKEWGLNTIISMVDLTTLEGARSRYSRSICSADSKSFPTFGMHSCMDV